jgi:hypothetical protein
MIVPHWILYSWFALAALSTAYVTWDDFVSKNSEETVMKWGWILIRDRGDGRQSSRRRRRPDDHQRGRAVGPNEL